MHLHPFRLLFALLILATTIASTTSAASSTTDDRAETVAATAIELSREAENGDYFAMYDRLHPDVRNALPREAFFEWAESGDMAIPLDDPALGEVSFEDWTWDAGDDEYDEAALVPYTQSVERNGVAEDVSGTFAFVHDGQRWRWFPNLTGSDLEGLSIALEAQPETYEPPFRQAAYARIDRFWEGAFAAAGLDYEPVRDIVPVTSEPFETGCGVEDNIEEIAIYYCTGDSTIYYDPGFRDQVIDITGSYGWTMIVAHEWGHHVQWLLEIDMVWDPELDDGLYPIEIELQADCLAGIYTQDAFALGLVDDDDVEAAAEITNLAGDTPGTAWDDYTAHGTSDQRVQSLFTGFEDGFAGCNLDLPVFAE